MDKFLQQVTQDDDNFQYVEALEHTINHIPQRNEDASYSVRHTWKVTAHSNVTNRSLPAVLRPLNVVCIDMLSNNEEGLFSDAVAHSFDLQHCMVSLRITEDGLYKYVMSSYTRSCVAQKKLVLRQTAFRGYTVEDAIQRQLHRILKYLKRGFSW